MHGRTGVEGFKPTGKARVVVALAPVSKAEVEIAQPAASTNGSCVHTVDLVDLCLQYVPCIVNFARLLVDEA